jgi:hypothetical protein
VALADSLMLNRAVIMLGMRLIQVLRIGALQRSRLLKEGRARLLVCRVRAKRGKPRTMVGKKKSRDEVSKRANGSSRITYDD